MRHYLVVIGALFLFIQCKDNPPLPDDPKKTDKRDNFVGKYKVISETPNYYFSCEKFDTINQTWIRLNNICNSFNMEFNVIEDNFDKNVLEFPSYFPIVDKYNNRWDFGVYANDTIRNVNLIVNDTFRLYYRLQNMPWHAEDDTAYMNKMFLMVAVRGQ